MQLAEDDEARARRGPVSREQAREMQRKRILNAMVGEVGERGLRGATVAGVSARAGVSRSTFYELFDDLEACILAVLTQVTTRSTALMSEAFEREARWQDGVLAALAALLVSLDREPLLARVCLLETLAGSPAVLRHRARELAALNPLVDVGRAQAHASGEPPELTAEASVASVAGILHTRLVTGGLRRSSACSASWWALSSLPISIRMTSCERSREARRWRARSPRNAPPVRH